ncbi:unnamed protein product, partial [Heterotrigona itama]
SRQKKRLSRRDLTRDGLVDAFGGDEYGTEEAGGSLYTIARYAEYRYDRCAFCAKTSGKKFDKFVSFALADAYYRNVPYSVITGNR